MLAVLALAHIPVRAAESESPGGVKWKVCEHPPLCFASKQARLDWANANHCRFLEDVCEHPPTNDDNKGASEADRGFWGDLWDGVKTGLTYGYEFVKGLVAGLKDQAQGLVDLLRNFDDVLSGLISLGKSFYNDPGGTIKQLAEILGQDAVDTITKATMCGAYDTGKVVGQNINPVVIAKLATKIARYSGDLTRAARATKVELGCASFVAGTPVITPAGSVAIERIVAGQTVMSRSERGFSDAPQQVTKTFSRRVEGYRSVTTEFDTLNVTEEHPFWLQGKGWTPVKELKRGDVVATAYGDVTVLGNEWVERSTQIYNFSVDGTPSYFVGYGVWAHNASCDLSKDWGQLKPKEKGYRAELDVVARLELKGYTRVGNTFDPGKYPDVDGAFKAWDGQTGIDGIFKNAKGEYVIVESKGKGVSVKDDVAGCVDRLCNTGKGRQMSEDWIDANLDKIVTDPVEAKKIRDGLANGKTKRIYAQTDGDTTIFNEIITPGTDLRAAEIGKTWHP